MRRVAGVIFWGSALFLWVACWKALILVYLPSAASDARVNTLASIVAFLAAFLSILVVLLAVSIVGLMITPLHRRLNAEHLVLDQEADALREQKMLGRLLHPTSGGRSGAERGVAETDEMDRSSKIGEEVPVGAAAGPQFHG